MNLQICLILAGCLAAAFGADVNATRKLDPDSNRFSKLLKDPKNGQQFFNLLDRHNIINKREAQAQKKSPLNNSEKSQPRTPKRVNFQNSPTASVRPLNNGEHNIRKRQIGTLAVSQPRKTQLFGTLAQPRAPKSLNFASTDDSSVKPLNNVKHTVGKRQIGTLAISQPHNTQLFGTLAQPQAPKSLNFANTNVATARFPTLAMPQPQASKSLNFANRNDAAASFPTLAMPQPGASKSLNFANRNDATASFPTLAMPQPGASKSLNFANSNVATARFPTLAMPQLQAQKA